MKYSALAAFVFLAGCAGSSSVPAAGAYAGVAVTGATAKAGNHSMWLWPNGGYPQAIDVVTWCEAHGVADVFLYVYAKNGKLIDSRDIESYANAVAGTGINLYALNGEARWIEHPKLAVAWENAVNASGLFAGIHLDTEPNQVSGWTAYNKPGAVQADSPIIKHFYTMLQTVRANSPSTHLEVDVQFADADYTQALGFPTQGYGSFGEALVAMTDELTVMSYRTVLDGNNGLLAISAPMLALASQHAKPMRLGIETTKDPADPQDSFWGHPQSDVRKMLKAVDNAEASSTAYDGTSVEEYVSWTELR
ncbi:MAG TPA: hypothetical protein VGF18_10440 [Candidatus Tumulicola sp.]